MCTLSTDQTITGLKTFPADGTNAPVFNGHISDHLPALKLINDGPAPETLDVYSAGGGNLTVYAGAMMTDGANGRMAALATGLLKSTTTSGLISIATDSDYVAPALLAAMRDPTGFADRTKSTIAFTVAGTGAGQTRTFDIAHAVDATFDIYSGGVRYAKTHDTVAIPDESGLYYIYYSTVGVLTCSEINAAWDIKSANIPVATVYWNANLDEGLLGDERHGIQMDGKTHEYLHETRGPAFSYGLTGTFTNTTLAVAAGEWYDDDLEYIFSGTTTPAAPLSSCRVLWRIGTAWTWGAEQATYFHNVSSVPQYNSGSASALSAMGMSYYSNAWFYISNLVNSTTGAHEPIVVVMGQSQYANNTTGRNAALAEGPDSLLFGALPIAEMLLLYKVTFQRHDSGITYYSATDYRRLTSGPANSYVATDHSGLSHLDAATSGHTGYAFTGDISTRDTLGLDTNDSPQFAGINLGHASDTTLARENTGFGDMTVEGSHVVRMAGTPWNDTLAALATAQAWYPFGDGGELGQYPHAIGLYRVHVYMRVTSGGTTGATTKFSFSNYDATGNAVAMFIPMANDLGTMMTAGACPLTATNRVYHGSALVYSCNSGTGEDLESMMNMELVAYTANGATADIRARLEYLGA
jgi:hypothetical protein